MPDYGPQNLSDLIAGIKRAWGIEKKLEEAEIIQAWAELAGPRINSLTDSVRLREGVLVVHITSAAWRQELHFERRSWCDRLNKSLGKVTIKEVQFR